VLDLFKEDGEGGGNPCYIFMNYMTPVCSQDFLPKKQLWKSNRNEWFESKRNSWPECSTSYEGCHNVNLKKITNSFYMFSPNSVIAYGMGAPCYTDEINVDIGKPMM